MDAKGGWAQRSWHLIDALELLGRVDIATLSGDAALIRANRATCANRGEHHIELWCPPGDWVDRWHRFGLKSLADLAKLSRRNKTLETHLQAMQYDAVVVRLLRSSLYLSVATDRNVIVDIDDTAIEYRDGFGFTRASLFRYHVANKLRGLFSRAAIGRIGRAWVVNRDYTRLYDFKHVTFLPNIPKCIPETLGDQRGDDRTLLFVGDLATNRHNLRSLQFFIARILPEILKQEECTLLLAGAMEEDSPFDDIRGVELVKNPESLASVYQRATVAIAPQLSGKGTSIKVLEALAFGRPIVVSPVAARGFDELENCGVILARSPEEFARTCIELLRNGDARGRTARAGYEIVKRNYSKEVFSATVRRSVEQVCDA